MNDKQIREYINARTYRQCSIEEAVHLALCLEGKTYDECAQYLDGIIYP